MASPNDFVWFAPSVPVFPSPGLTPEKLGSFGFDSAVLNNILLSSAVERYGVIPFVDLGTKAGTNDPVSTINGQGETSLYAVRFGMDGFHGVAPTGNALIKSWLPDYKTAGAVKTGEVEMVAAVALKATKAAGIFRKIKVK